MKYVLASIAALAMSCTTNPPILPEPLNATTGAGGFGGNGGAGGMDASSSVTSSSASGSSGSSLPGDGSGTRLKRYVYKSDDGLVSGRPNPFFDSALNTDCSPVKTVAGMRCVPSPATITWFSDAQCTKPVAYLSKQCPAPKYGCAYGKLVCTDVDATKCYNINPTPIPTAYASDSQGGCVDVFPTYGNVYTFYAAESEVDYSQFAAMTLEHE